MHTFQAQPVASVGDRGRSSSSSSSSSVGGGGGGFGGFGRVGGDFSTSSFPYALVLITRPDLAMGPLGPDLVVDLVKNPNR